LQYKLTTKIRRRSALGVAHGHGDLVEEAELFARCVAMPVVSDAIVLAMSNRLETPAHSST
jgi:hypothetical protein